MSTSTQRELDVVLIGGPFDGRVRTVTARPPQMVWVQLVGDGFRLFRSKTRANLYLYRQVYSKVVNTHHRVGYLYASLRWAECCGAWHEKPLEDEWTCQLCGETLRAAS